MSLLLQRIAMAVSIIASPGTAVSQVSESLPLSTISRSGRPGFQRVSPEESGITFRHSISATRHQTNQMLLDGSGVALGDVDRDGRVDVFLAATSGGSQLWRNEGNWHFRDITGASFPGGAGVLSGDVTGAVLADVNADGAPDLILNTHADGIRVLLNDGKAGFRPMTFPQSTARGGHSLAVADVDGDGWVDLYVCNYRERALMDMPSARATFSGSGVHRRVATLDGRPTTAPDLTNRFVVNAAGGLDELGEVDVLYRNLHGTNFDAVSWTGGAFLDEDGKPLGDSPRDWGLAAQFFDVNGDGRPDLYVCNDFQTPDRFWINEGSPGVVRFRLVRRDALRHTSLFSMGVDFGDVNRDGRPDFMVVDMLSSDHVRRLTMLDGTPTVPVDPSDPLSRPQTDANTLFLQRPDGSFTDVAAFAGVTATDWSWTPAFVDVDLDGWTDLLVTAGQERGSRDLDIADHMKAFRRSGLRTDAQIFRERQKFPRLPARLQAFRNLGPRGEGAIPVFEDTATEWGLQFVGVSHGMALGDLDGDGDPDLVVNHLNESAGLYRNTAPGPRLQVLLHGRAPNTQAIGAVLRFGWGPDPLAAFRDQPQSAQVVTGGRYLSSDDVSRTFACPGPGTGLLEVRWPSGRISVVKGMASNQRWILEEPGESESSAPVDVRKVSPRLVFESRPTTLVSASATVDEFALQPLLPRKRFTRTPALAWATNGSSHSFWMGGIGSQPLRKVEVSKGAVTTVRDAGPARATEDLVVLDGQVVAAEAGSGSDPVLIRIREGFGTGEAIPSSVLAPGSLAVGSGRDGAGRWLFAGGGAIPGGYPASSPSEFFQVESGRLLPLGATNLGLVTASAFGDLDGDGHPELCVVGEWMAPRIFRETHGQWEGWNPPLEISGMGPTRLGDLTGWWQSVRVTDLDGDGHADVVLGNWGLNSAFALHSGRPRELGGPVRPLGIFFGGATESEPGLCVLSYSAEGGRVLPVQGRTELGPRIPWLSERFPTYRALAMATIPEIFGERFPAMNPLEARWMASLLLLNRGDRFLVRELPAEAQLGPVLSWAAADFDGDGHEDLYGAQGFFGHNFGMPRDDAGEGVFLLGRGGGTFVGVPTASCGFRLLGEQRSTLAGDVDGDGRPDLVVGIHGGPVTLLLNRSPKP